MAQWCTAEPNHCHYRRRHHPGKVEHALICGSGQILDGIVIVIIVVIEIKDDDESVSFGWISEKQERRRGGTRKSQALAELMTRKPETQQQKD